MMRRSIVLAAILLAAHVWMGRAAPAAAPQADLSTLPLDLGPWKGRDFPPFDAAILRTLGADGYLNRAYATADGRAVGLYVAHYRWQQAGDAIHSPRHCLPGNGWEPVSAAVARLPTREGHTLPVNRYVVRKGDRRQLVLYWFQGRGRAVASEYANRLYLALDGLRDGRTDGALVRIIAPVRRTEAAAEAAAVDFLRSIHPHLIRGIP